MDGKAKPVLLAMMICDQVIREEQTQKVSLIGVFNTIQSRRFPCVHTRMHIYIALTEFEGAADAELRFLDARGQVIVSVPGPLQFIDKLAVAELNIELTNLPIPAEGTYDFEFLVSKQLVGHRKFLVKKV